jgi:hypothetical protein
MEEGSKDRRDRLELEVRAVEKSMDHSDHTPRVSDIQNAEEDKRQEGDPQESVVD